MKREETTLVCTPAALDKEPRAHYTDLTKQLLAAKGKVRELPDGYAVRFIVNKFAERKKCVKKFSRLVTNRNAARLCL